MHRVIVLALTRLAGHIGGRPGAPAPTVAVVMMAIAAVVFGVGLLAASDSQAGSESRCAALGLNCICSEPMQTATWTATGNRQNPADTTATDKQCSLGGAGEFLEWLDCCIQTMEGVTPAQEAAAFARLPSGHSLSHVARLPTLGAGGSQGGGSFGHNRLTGTSFVKRVAVRWYQYYSPDYQFSSDGACQNNKFLVLTNGDVISEGDSGGNFHMYFLPNSECCIAGPGPDEMSITPANVRGKWWRAEFVVVNRAGGASPNGIKYYFFMKNITDNGPELRIVDSTFAGSVSGWVPNNGLSPLARIDSIGSDLHRFPDGTCAGYRAFTHFMTAGWDTDTGQRIGAAVEVEGALPPVPPAPSNLIVQ
jgi:hypothetical protein